MGTNYYLRKKCDYNKRYPGVVGDSETYLSQVQELVNGYVWNNKYFKTVEELNKEYFVDIHIGKNSCGWKFALCTYPDKYEEKWSYVQDDVEHQETDVTYLLPEPIRSLDDWKKLFDDPNCSIYDEYGDKVSKEDMIKVITSKNIKDVKAGRSDKYTTLVENENYDLVLSGNDPERGCVFC